MLSHYYHMEKYFTHAFNMIIHKHNCNKACYQNPGSSWIILCYYYVTNSVSINIYEGGRNGGSIASNHHVQTEKQIKAIEIQVHCL